MWRLRFFLHTATTVARCAGCFSPRVCAFVRPGGDLALESKPLPQLVPAHSAPDNPLPPHPRLDQRTTGVVRHRVVGIVTGLQQYAGGDAAGGAADAENGAASVAEKGVAVRGIGALRVTWSGGHRGWVAA